MELRLLHRRCSARVGIALSSTRESFQSCLAFDVLREAWHHSSWSEIILHGLNSVLLVFDQEFRVVAAAQFSGEGRQFALPAFCFFALLDAVHDRAVFRSGWWVPHASCACFCAWVLRP